MADLVAKTEDLKVTSADVSPLPQTEVVQKLVTVSGLVTDRPPVPVQVTAFGRRQAHVWIGGTSGELGNMVASFPHRNLYDGSSLPVTTHLMGGEGDDETGVAQMATRLTVRTGWPVFLSSSFVVDVGDEEGEKVLRKVEKEIVDIIEILKAKS
mmetsp:Transcript_18462/g.36956  ORF Transcript_18462/g.36956 Transcript_18462/m.36956 type:complete len:154 (+) Transcript_18462:88-549(+)|eukprot:CAMPEP_0182454456 /NCGR_PEP_ID=MMETSP1319-20130603/1089_1 /TAXON_ID=172717 /ORGANISM="Bolidomonas pacifica, Strain RCC208" /LENGTH=153 /DNA_ID=CAMNT_0024652473 /DNA_START=88 /DNA_END=549 /DNA_ORIENTATION=-